MKQLYIFINAYFLINLSIYQSKIIYSGGMSNLLYYCALIVNTIDDEPKMVLLRLYGPAHGDTDVQLEIFNQLAAKNLGPALYGNFDEGRLEEYLPSNPLTWTELTDDRVSAAVAKKIAAIHKLNVKSLVREPNWLIDKYNQYYGYLAKINKKPPVFNEGTLDTTKMIANELLEIDFEIEINHMEKLFHKSNAPLVFSHNDLHQNNILLLQEDLKEINDEDRKFLDDRIVLIDFEYCSYNYRTFDIANHLSEWCFDYNGQEYPFFNACLDRFPSEERQRKFLEFYINELSENCTNGKETTNTSDLQPLSKTDKIDILFKEMQPFIMASNLLWSLWAIYSAYTSKINFGYWVSSTS